MLENCPSKRSDFTSSVVSATLLAFSTVGLSGCAKLPTNNIAACHAMPTPSETAGLRPELNHTKLDVLTFNIEGLSWPARSGRNPSLRKIGAILAKLNARGDAPDIVVVQEAFSDAAAGAMSAAGYTYNSWGPSRLQLKRFPELGKVAGPYRWKRGEIGYHLVGSGLVVLSRFPIIAARSEPFGAHHCAGYDCLSNKGVQYARVSIPGVPQSLEIFNTHLNSQGASGVPQARNGSAQAHQMNDLSLFINGTSKPGNPAIFAGDFNLAGTPDRLHRLESKLDGFRLSHRECLARGNACEKLRVPTTVPAWLNSEDLQLFRSGQIVKVAPIKIEAMFDGSVDDDKLSDHDGLRVTYLLSSEKQTLLTPIDRRFRYDCTYR